MGVKIRFECGQEDRVSEEFGPFPFVQLTYGDLRVGPDGTDFADFSEEHDWHRVQMARGDDTGELVLRHATYFTIRDPERWSDVVIYADDGERLKAAETVCQAIMKIHASKDHHALMAAEREKWDALKHWQALARPACLWCKEPVSEGCQVPGGWLHPDCPNPEEK